jgi:hypothetical protein
MDPGTDRVGVLGLGAMGRPMTEHLLRRPDTPVAIHGRGRDLPRESTCRGRPEQSPVPAVRGCSRGWDVARSGDRTTPQLRWPP